MEDKDNILKPLIILNVIIIIITLYLSILFCISKSFHSIPCYNMIIFSFILCLDNILRIIPFKDKNDQDTNPFEYMQAFLLVFFDKLILAILSMQSLIYYLGIVKTKFYFDNEKKIFIITLVINLIVCLTLSGVYISFGITPFQLYYYCVDPENGIKKILDTIFISIYALINNVCLICTLFYISKKRKDTVTVTKEEFNMKHYFIKTLTMFFLNNFTFIESYLIIYDILENEYTELIYLSTCLLIGIFNSLNKTVFEETSKIFCKKRVQKQTNIPLKTVKTYDDEEDEEDSNRNTGSSCN